MQSFFLKKKLYLEEKNGGTGIRARVKRITTAYANHYTIPPVLILSEIWRIQYKHALIAQLGER